MKKIQSSEELFNVHFSLREANPSNTLIEMPPLKRRELLELGCLLAYDHTIAELKAEDTQIVWHIAMPKSGCTWLTKILSYGLSEHGWQAVSLVPEAKRREQVVSATELLRQQALNNNVFAIQQHCLFSEHALKFIKQFDVKLIIQVRSIYDCILSFIDHLDRADVIGPTAYLTNDIWQKYSIDEKLNFVVDNVVPWYIQFWVSWSLGLKGTNVQFKVVRYETLLNETESQVYQLAKFCNVELLNDDLNTWINKPKNEDTRKNKGVIGRGDNLPQWVYDRVSRLSSYYPDVDFSLIGIK